MRSRKHIVKMLSVFTLLLIFNFTLPVYAEEGVDNNDYSNEVVPGYEKTERWSYTSSVNVAMTINSNGYTTANCSVSGYQNLTTKVITYVYLQKYVNGSWINVDNFSNVSYGTDADVFDSFGVYAVWGHDYRTYNSIYVYAGDSYEHIGLYSRVHHYHSSSDGSNCIS